MKRVRPRLISIITTNNNVSQQNKGSGDNRHVMATAMVEGGDRGNGFLSPKGIYPILH